MKAIQGCDQELDILPNKESNIPTLNCESLPMHALSERIDLHDSQCVKLAEHEHVIKDMIALTREYEVLKANVKKLTEWMNMCVTSKSVNTEGQRAVCETASLPLTDTVPIPTPQFPCITN